MFADDVAAIVVGESTTHLESRLADVSNQLKHWFHINGLALNLTKTQFVHINLSGRPQRPLDIQIDNVTIKQAYTTTFLGFQLDSGLSWSDHIDKLCGRLGQTCFALGRMSAVLPGAVVRSCYFATVQSLLQYGVELWARGADWDRVFVLQKRAVRIVARVPADTHMQPYFRELRIMTLPSLYIFAVAMYAREHMVCYERRGENHNYNLRGAGKLQSVPHRLAKSDKVTHVLAPFLYNRLPHDIVDTPSLPVFKRKLKNWLIEQAFYDYEILTVIK
ncbi:hypothetical protein O0L34_g13636 [Tuta absoluta]|nr:hypothetical protein O0L34_g13636 [Tuta absoluta]